MSYIICKGRKCYVIDGRLDLSNHFIVDISKIRGLKDLVKLRELDLRENNIHEIKGLETLTELKQLNLSHNKITEIKGLEKLIKLEKLTLDYSNISEIKGLETLTELKELNLSDNKITEIKGLETLTNLSALKLSGNNLSKIKGLEALINLQELDLYAIEIREIEGLETLTKLQDLNIGYNGITEVKGLDTLTELRKLNIFVSDISEIKGLDSFKNLRELRLFGNNISEIKGLEKLIKLEKLTLDYSNISEIKGLETLTELKELNLWFNKITEIKGLETLVKLKSLNLKKNPIKNEEYYLVKKSAQEVVQYCRMKKQKKFEFDFAFTFAGEDRATVRKVKNSLVRRGIRVFFDEDFEWDLIGKNLSNRFKETYGKNTNFVIIFISKYYKIKEWTDFEFQIAREEANSREEEFILPIRLDDTIVLGVDRDIKYIDYRKTGTRGVVNLLSKKLEDFNNRHNIPYEEYSEEYFTDDNYNDYEDDRTNEEIQIETELINSYIDMLESGKIRYSRVKEICYTINMKCYPIILVKDLNVEILICCSRVSSYFCKEIGNVDEEAFKNILECLEGFTRKPELLEILKGNCDINKFIAFFEGGIMESKLLSILYELSYFADLVLRLKKAFNEKEFELVNALTLLVWRKKPKIERIEILTFFNEKLNDSSFEKNKDTIKFIEILKSNLEFERDIYNTPDFDILNL